MRFFTLLSDLIIGPLTLMVPFSVGILGNTVACDATRSLPFSLNDYTRHAHHW